MYSVSCRRLLPLVLPPRAPPRPHPASTKCHDCVRLRACASQPTPLEGTWSQTFGLSKAIKYKKSTAECESERDWGWETTSSNTLAGFLPGAPRLGDGRRLQLASSGALSRRVRLKKLRPSRLCRRGPLALLDLILAVMNLKKM